MQPLKYPQLKMEFHKVEAMILCNIYGRFVSERNGRLKRLTRDHTVVNLLLEMGKIDKVEARRHPGIRVLTRHVGMQPTALPEAAALEVEAGDRLLQCSDGLWGTVRDKSFQNIPGADLKLAEIFQEMITAANAAGGPDNITALVIQVNSLD